jgi:3-deoxy-D-manno-octulosonic-acid transferase
VPALVGPHTFNFQEITALLESVGAVARIADGDSLGATLCAWLREPEERMRRGEAGRERIAQERGALARTLRLVEESLAYSRPVLSSAASASATR